MKTFRVNLKLVEVFSDHLDVKAESEEKAKEIALELAGELEFQDLEDSETTVTSVES